MSLSRPKPNQWVPRIQTIRAVNFEQQNLAVLAQDPKTHEVSFTYLPEIFEEKQEAVATQPR